MPRKKAVKVRKWVTCAEPGCKKRALATGVCCGEHQKKRREKLARITRATAADLAWVTRATAADKKGKTQPPKPARKKSQKEMTAAAAKRKKITKRPFRGKKVLGAPPSRLIKAYCEKCGYTIRLSRKWIEVKRPQCPVCLKNMVTEIDGEKKSARQFFAKGGV